MKAMTDYHVHIGQWFDKYFSAREIFSVLKKNGVDECWFSSTTSCIYSKESEAAKNDAKIFKNAPSAIELYGRIQNEIQDALQVARELDIKAHPLYWLVPEIEKAIYSIRHPLSEIRYEGVKIHPRAQKWNIETDEKIRIMKNGKPHMFASKLYFEDTLTGSDVLTDFDIANIYFLRCQNQNLRVLIHTGCDEKTDSPRKFEAFIKAFPNCLVQLAHLKDLDAQEYMLKTYPNVVVDSSFAGQVEVDELIKRGVDSSRILWGSDMPVSYVWANRDNVNVSPEPEKDDLIRFYGERHNLP